MSMTYQVVRHRSTWYQAECIAVVSMCIVIVLLVLGIQRSILYVLSRLVLIPLGNI